MALEAFVTGSSGNGVSSTSSFRSCLRTILKFLYQSRKLVPVNLSFSKIDHNDREFVFEVVILDLQENAVLVSKDLKIFNN